MCWFWVQVKGFLVWSGHSLSFCFSFKEVSVWFGQDDDDDDDGRIDQTKGKKGE